jgi:hypothetical protein
MKDIRFLRWQRAVICAMASACLADCKDNAARTQALIFGIASVAGLVHLVWMDYRSKP